ncbi:MAG: hypothetical protein KJ077_12125 [Anaerolineae bacterium]|nr:hypothetical protein [Anaerolineae bacterium]
MLQKPFYNLAVMIAMFFVFLATGTFLFVRGGQSRSNGVVKLCQDWLY